MGVERSTHLNNHENKPGQILLSVQPHLEFLNLALIEHSEHIGCVALGSSPLLLL